MTIQEANSQLGQQLGLTNPDGNAFDGSHDSIASLSSVQSAQLTNTLNAYIVANPALFTSYQVQLATGFNASPLSLADGAPPDKGFLGDALDELSKIIKAGEHTLVVAAVIVALLYTSPLWLPKIKAALA